MLGALLLCLLCAGEFRAQAPAGGELPAGEGEPILRRQCLSCHGADLITSQRLSDAGWGRELDKMSGWGATLTAPDRTALVAYLARHFAPVPAIAHAAAAPGEAVFARVCLTCHGADLTEQQRLSPSGWSREVEKMMRWGAQLTDAEKTALVDYLAARFSVR